MPPDGGSHEPPAAETHWPRRSTSPGVALRRLPAALEIRSHGPIRSAPPAFVPLGLSGVLGLLVMALLTNVYPWADSLGDLHSDTTVHVLR